MIYAVNESTGSVRMINDKSDLLPGEKLSNSPEVTPSEDYAALIAQRRYEAETGGMQYAGLFIETDDRSKLLINGAALEATMDPAYSVRWKTSEGFVTFNSHQAIGLARAVRAHVQACFDREAELLEEVADGTFDRAHLDTGWPE